MGNTTSSSQRGLFTAVEANTNLDFQVNKQIQQNLFDNISSTINENYTSSTNVATNNQTLVIKDVQGCGLEGINIQGVNQSSTTKLDVQSMVSLDNREQLSSQIQASIEATLASYQEARGRSLFTGAEINTNIAYKNNETIQTVSRKVTNEIINRNITEFNNNAVNNQFLEISELTTCRVGLDSPGGPINISDISQSNAFSIYSAQIATAASKYLQEYIDVSGSTASLSTTQKTGISLIAVFVVLVIIGMIVGIYYGVKKKKEKKEKEEAAAAAAAPAPAAASTSAAAPSGLSGFASAASSLVSNPQVQAAASKFIK